MGCRYNTRFFVDDEIIIFCPTALCGTSWKLLYCGNILDESSGFLSCILLISAASQCVYLLIQNCFSEYDA